MTFNCEVSDGTDTYAFTEDSERLFGMTATDVFKMKHTVSYFNAVPFAGSYKANVIFVVYILVVWSYIGDKTTIYHNLELYW